MPVKKGTPSATQLSLEGTTPSRAGSAQGTRNKNAGPKARGARGTAAAGKRHPRPAGSAKPDTELAAAVRALEHVALSLHFTHESFAQSLLRLPRAEDYDPLTDALRRLAAATPALLASRAPAPPSAAPGPARDRGSSVEARSAILAARERIERALDGLPTAADYEPTARNLREMATVSPSLMEWLREVPALATPLADSVEGLREALVELDRAFEALDDDPIAATPGVKVVVRG